MSEDDVLFGYRLRVLDYAARASVSEACRVFGIHRSTFYVWKRRVERHGLEILDTEIVGMSPEAALTDSAAYYLQLKGFDPDEQILVPLSTFSLKRSGI